MNDRSDTTSRRPEGTSRAFHGEMREAGPIVDRAIPVKAPPNRIGIYRRSMILWLLNEAYSAGMADRSQDCFARLNLALVVVDAGASIGFGMAD